MSWCTRGVGLQVLPSMDNRYLGSIQHFHQFSCYEFVCASICFLLMILYEHSFELFCVCRYIC